MVKSLILCEGGDDVGFFTKLCKYLLLDMDMIDIKKMSGKSNFFKEESYDTYKQQIESGMYDKILFVVDSDDVECDAKYSGYKNSITELNLIIDKLGFEAISDIYIMCDPKTRDGNLEHFLLSTIVDSKKSCITTFLSCIDGMETHKNKKILLSSYQSIFKDTPYNFDHTNFKPLIEKLNNINNN